MRHDPDEGKPGEADLYEANLSGENVNEVILTRANLSGANLRARF